MGVFPKNFFWGAATSAHQVEGGNQNDWTAWEQKNAKRLASAALRRYWHLPSWPEIKDQTTDPKNYISGRACEHYTRYEGDFDLIRELRHTAHRFSIEWSRIEPEEGEFNEGEIEHYRRVIRALRARGIEPIVTLWHWTLPQWVAKKGGVLAPRFLEHVERYVTHISQKLGGEVLYWITINEPEIFSLNSYLRALWPPQKRNIIEFYEAEATLIRAHRSMYKILKKSRPITHVGLSVNLSYFESAGGIFNDLLKKILDRAWNFHILNHVARHADFIGLNYYFHNRINYGLNKNENRITSDMGVEIYPDGLLHVLKSLARYCLPIIITENGLADARDEKRADYIRSHIHSIKEALSEGIDVRGYLHWSLLDNFEWDRGFWPRFGLVEVDYKTMGRTIRASAHEYRKIIEESSKQ